MATREVSFYDTTGTKGESLKLDLPLVKKDVSEKTLSLAVRTLLQNWRQGTVACKSRGEVSFSNKKPWKQKGTGRARAGSLRSPLWRSGGVTFGPQKRTKTFSINKKQRKIVFNNLFFNALEKQNIYCTDFGVSGSQPSTKQAFKLLDSMSLVDQKIVLFLPFSDVVNAASFRNLPNVNIVYFDQPNAFDLCDGHYWLFLKKDLDIFKEMIARWN